MKRSLIIAAIALVLIAAFVGGFYLYKSGQAQLTAQAVPQGAGRSERVESPSLGPLPARVQITEFFDPACEACRAYYPYVKQIMEANAGGVRLILRYAAFHKGSDYVIRVLEAARMQGQDVYWKALEAVLAAQPQWADHGRPQPELVWNFLGDIGLDIERAKRDMNDASITGLLEQDAADIVAMDVQKTPSFFINGKPLRQSNPEGLAAQVAQELMPN